MIGWTRWKDQKKPRFYIKLNTEYWIKFPLWEPFYEIALKETYDLQAWANCLADADWARWGTQNLQDVLNLSGTHIFPCKKKKTLNLQVFSWIGKTIKKLQWIPNTIINTSVLEYFDNVYIFDGFITALSSHELGSI